jgi:cephalosporin-C deacetylase
MPWFDIPQDQLSDYRPDTASPSDLEAFWQSSLAETRGLPLDAVFTPFDAGLPGVRVWDLEYAGFAGQRVKGWFILPAQALVDTLPTRDEMGRIPCVVEYIGYGGGRGLPHQWLFWPAAGLGLLVMDTRGQGSVWQTGDTPDVEPAGSNPQAPGFMTRGVLDKRTYYYRRVYVDAVRAVEAVIARDEINADRVFLTGGSQGGGIALAGASLIGRFPPIKPDGRPFSLAGALPDVPFLCHFRRATEITASFPYGELVQFAKNHRLRMEQMFDTLAYFDCANLAPWADCPTLFSVALMDDICPPSTVYAAYNAYGSNQTVRPPRDIRVWPYNGHEGGQQFQTGEKLDFVRALLSRTENMV